MTIRVGVQIPGYHSNPKALRQFLQGVEQLGYSHVSWNEHIVGANPAAYPDFDFQNHNTLAPWHESISLMGFIAGCTDRLEMNPSLFVLPLRNAVLAAKQTAHVDQLSGGRVRLVVGLSWNEPEFRALGADFPNRAAIVEEQIAVLRALWTQPLVDFAGAHYTLRQNAVNPRPVQQPIPIWMGAGQPRDGLPRSQRALRRIARLADGFKFQAPVRPPQARPVLEQLRTYLRENGRDPATFGVEGRMGLRGSPDEWAAQVQDWRALGVSHITVGTGIGVMAGTLGDRGAGLGQPGFTSAVDRDPDEHLTVLRRFMEDVLQPLNR